MSCSRLLIPLYLLSISLLFQLGLAIDLDSYSIYCSQSSFLAGGPYNKNLNNLVRYLDSKTPLTGFGSGSQGLGQNRTYGLALCRGDINSRDCKACVDQASNEIQKVCKLKKEAIAWYDVCMLKYSNLSFLGKIDNKNWYFEESTNFWSNPGYFNKEVIQILSTLQKEAYVSPKMYAAGALEIGNSTTLYGLVQCTRDLSSANCNICLEEAIGAVTPYFHGSVGGKIWGGSCNVRYEIYPFFNA
ncbi:hypothetical protein Vadar_011581 [Vaccinium darrowii]|uniref:Uncharacterized protein n=1 Tax=Vaccinium darrowii TaxID=229202 RepID=A0ACB7Z3E3_9ERIC|nr:hypothetical protein Vadar_011581 [Vaccinium darrowii]